MNPTILASAIFSSILLIWVLIGGVWFPLANIFRHAQKGLGFLAAALLIGTLFKLKPATRIRNKIHEYIFTTIGKNKFNTWLGIFTLFNILSIIVVYKHNSLQSYMHDFALFLNSTWNFAHGNGWYDPIIHVDSFLGDHWSPVLILFVPFMYFWASADPFLLAQALSLVTAMMLLYKIALHFKLEREWALLIPILYLLHPYFHNLHRFDFHPEVIGIPIFLLGVYLFLKDHPWWGFFCFALVWNVKEDLPINTFSIAIWLWVVTRHRKQSVLVMLSSIGMFLLTVGVLMPYFLGHHDHTHMVRYANLGESFPEIAKSILFSPHLWTWDIISDPKVWETLFELLLPLFFLPFWGGLINLSIFFMWLPHMISHYSGQRYLTGPYSSTILSILCVSAAIGVARILDEKSKWPRLKSKLIQWGPYPFALIMVIHWAFGVPRYTTPTTRERVEAFHHVAAQIPEGAPLSAQGNLGSHLFHRKQLNMFPDRDLVNFVITEPNGNPWPLTREAYIEEWNKMNTSGIFEPIFESHGFTLHRRVEPKKPKSYE